MLSFASFDYTLIGSNRILTQYKLELGTKGVSDPLLSHWKPEMRNFNIQQEIPKNMFALF